MSLMEQAQVYSDPSQRRLPPIQQYNDQLSTPSSQSANFYDDDAPWPDRMGTPRSSFSPYMPPPGDLSRQISPTPAPLPSRILQPISPPAALVVDLLAVENVARDFGLPKDQADMLKNFVKLGSTGVGLTKPDMLTRLFHLATTMYYENQRPKDDANDVQTLRGIIKDLKIRLESSFSLTSDQNKNIRMLAFDKIYNPLRTSYMAINADIFEHLQARADELHFSNVFGNPVYEVVLERAIRKTCSSVRNGFRQHLRDSVKNGASAAVFTHRMNATYLRPGGPQYNDRLILLRNVILRNFVFRHADVLWEEEDTVNGLDEAQPDVCEPLRKRKKTSRNAGKKVKGQDFWSMVDEWYNEKKLKLGTKVTDPGWKQLLEDFMRFDEGDFKGLVPDGEPLQAVSTAGGAGGLPGSSVLALCT